MKFSIKDFFSKCDQIRSFLRIWSHLLERSVMENFIFCVEWMQRSLSTKISLPITSKVNFSTEELEKIDETKAKGKYFFVFVLVDIIRKNICLYLFIIFKVNIMFINFTTQIFCKQPSFLGPQFRFNWKAATAKQLSKLKSKTLAALWPVFMFAPAVTHFQKWLKKLKMKNWVNYKMKHLHYLRKL